MKGGLGKSLMERIVENHPETVTLLRMQYRMNEEIMRFSSDNFYHGAMVAAPDVKYRGILDYDSPIEWVDTAGLHGLESGEHEESKDMVQFRESLTNGSYGRVNRDEALLTLLTLQNYIERIGKERFLEERIDAGGDFTVSRTGEVSPSSDKAHAFLQAVPKQHNGEYCRWLPGSGERRHCHIYG